MQCYNRAKDPIGVNNGGEGEGGEGGGGGPYGHSTSGRFARSRRRLVRCLFLFIQNGHMTKETPIEEGSLVRCLYNSSSTSRSQGKCCVGKTVCDNTCICLYKTNISHGFWRKEEDSDMCLGGTFFGLRADFGHF